MILAVGSIVALIVSILGIKVSIKGRKALSTDFSQQKSLTHWGKIKEIGINGHLPLLNSFLNYSQEDLQKDLISDLFFGSKLTARKFSSFNKGLLLYLVSIVVALIVFTIQVFI
ncbi:MAG: hypothetical protein AAFR66_20980 [Bacteroidota bacterium]